MGTEQEDPGAPHTFYHQQGGRTDFKNICFGWCLLFKYNETNDLKQAVILWSVFEVTVLALLRGSAGPASPQVFVLIGVVLLFPRAAGESITQLIKPRVLWVGKDLQTHPVPPLPWEHFAQTRLFPVLPISTEKCFKNQQLDGELLQIFVSHSKVLQNW